MEMTMIGGFGLVTVLAALLSLATIIFWGWMLVDCLSNEPREGNDKVIWLLVLILVPFLGCLVYFFVRRPQRIAEHGA